MGEEIGVDLEIHVYKRRRKIERELEELDRIGRKEWRTKIKLSYSCV